MVLKKFVVNPDILKLVALITMTIDHVYKILIPDTCGFWFGTDVIGRIAMPLFAGLMMYHLAKKQIFKKYLIRLSCFGVISCLVFIPFSYREGTAAMPLNILLSFALSVLTIYLMNIIEKDYVASINIKRCAKIILLLFMAFFSLFFEYSLSGFCYLLMFYFYFKKPDIYKLCVLLALGILINDVAFSGIISMLTTLFFVNVDMEKSYPRLIKHWYTFYLYYPLHKVLLFSIAYLMMS